jgi:hypothetical protein
MGIPIDPDDPIPTLCPTCVADLPTDLFASVDFAGIPVNHWEGTISFVSDTVWGGPLVGDSGPNQPFDIAFCVEPLTGVRMRFSIIALDIVPNNHCDLPVSTVRAPEWAATVSEVPAP